ncbi:SCP2 sterol-binding domain-containing protein [Reichenbachiella versicolor]|uniref:SCP2 sterol-binding domain-containing protein n=1 Tax=Reichenbachiella versicolor TaxID=1821036 RepID=UPI000D6E9EA5|nr:SCP2 sterol-binding domain-containing protein [Reichenbachiella versicolor]
MTLEETTKKVLILASEKHGAIGKKIKFKFPEGVIVLDDTQVSTIVNNEDSTDIDCVIRISLENFTKLMTREINAMGAYMTGKIKIDGDMSVAMKLSSLF